MVARGTIEIAAGDWRAGIRPAAGGVLCALAHADHDVLRPMPAGIDDPEQSACFPMVPWTNRIRLGRFRFGGQALRLAPNRPPDRHPLNGFGWQRPWIVSELVGASAQLVLDHGGGQGWSWPFRATQRFALDEGGLTVELELANCGSEQMPAGIGLHPCFRRWRGSRARFVAQGVVLSDIEHVPTGEIALPDHFGDWSKGPTIPTHTVDHCYSGWDGTATIDDGLGTITMTATGAPHLHLFAPGTGDVLCCEPVNHLPDALNREDWAIPVLAPGESTTISMRIEEV